MNKQNVFIGWMLKGKDLEGETSGEQGLEMVWGALQG